MNDRSGGDESMTASAPGDDANGRRRLRVALLAVVAAVAVAAVIAFLSSHHKPNEPSQLRTLSDSHAALPSAASGPAGAVSSRGSNSASPSAPPASSRFGGSVAPLPTDPRAALKQQVISGYLAFEKTLNQQLAVIAPDMTPLQGVATGQILASSQSEIAELPAKVKFNAETLRSPTLW